jgi:hypothetical protein
MAKDHRRAGHNSAHDTSGELGQDMRQDIEAAKTTTPKPTTTITTRQTRSNKLVQQKPTTKETKEQPVKPETKSVSSLTETWPNACGKLLDDLIHHPDSEPFRHPVDLDEYPDYLSIIESEPMDLETISNKLLANSYSNVNGSMLIAGRFSRIPRVIIRSRGVRSMG